MKKIIAWILAGTIMATGVCAFAMEDQYAESTLTYTADDQFYISVPETINVGGESTVTATGVNIAPNKIIRVYVNNFESDSTIPLINVNDSQYKAYAEFYTASGERVDTSGNSIVQFQSGDSGLSKEFNTRLSSNSSDVAGEYTGTVQFRIACEESY